MDSDEFLEEAGLGDMLGIEEDRLAQSPKTARPSTLDEDLRMEDLETELTLAMEALADARTNLAAAEARNELLEEEVAKLTAELAAAKGNFAALKTRGAEQWAAQRALEDERDDLKIRLAIAEERAANATRAAEASLEAWKQEARMKIAAAKEEAAAAKRRADAAAAPAASTDGVAGTMDAANDS
eukprot:TRINITY_DN10807_c0_g1_i2.p2 TRINITY_DN10807_c0_g1~~TRINITY_DN10807_c0_g1_i2.p2  ORF type:complete len:185 (-),score=65.99 TRINITY_DN10807_c0_g1_i2:7-561(-)